MFAEGGVGGDVDFGLYGVFYAYDGFFPAAFGFGHGVVYFGFVGFQCDLDEVEACFFQCFDVGFVFEVACRW